MYDSNKLTAKKFLPYFEVGGPVQISDPRVHSPSFSYHWLPPTPRLKILKLGKNFVADDKMATPE